VADRNDEAAARAWEAFRSGRHDEATAICEAMLAVSPDHAGLRGISGIICGERGDFAMSVENFQRAKTLEPTNPDWSFNLGIAYLRDRRFSDAKAALFEALRLRPHCIEYLVELAVLHASLDEDREALRLCLEVIDQDANNADAHLLLAETLLRRGEMLLGWAQYTKGHGIRQERARLQRGASGESQITPPRWDGMQHPDAAILLHCDLGFSEMIQFARYIPLVAEHCGAVTVQTPMELTSLLSRSVAIAAVIPWGQTTETDHALQARLSELPGLFATTLERIPGSIPYLKADPDRVQMWREKLPARTAAHRMLVGLAWSGRTANERPAGRFLRFSQLHPLLMVPGVAFVSLQMPVSPADVEAMRGATVLDLSAELTDFGETAAVVANLDLVIAVDTAVAHLAGALGRDVWTLLPRSADWRWLRDRDDSPWYPTMRLFRQTMVGEWEEPLARAAAALAQLAEDHDNLPGAPPDLRAPAPSENR